jgi:hypothetical protein
MMVKKLVPQEKGCEEEDHEVENLVQQEKESEQEDHDSMKKLRTREGIGPQEEDHDCEEVYNKRRKESDLGRRSGWL